MQVSTKLVYLHSNIKMMHGPIRIRFKNKIVFFFLVFCSFCIVFLCMHDNFWLSVLISQLAFVLFSQHINKRGAELRSLMK